jgi:antagonist of KipI
MSFRVEVPGLLTSVQDAGRFGRQHLGVGSAGAADRLSHVLANLLVGNPPAAAALEFTLRGPTFVAECDLVMAFGGAPFPIKVDGQPLPRWRALGIRKGTRLEVGETPTGLRGYLAVAGGIQVPEVLGSRSTDLRGGFGGHEGRALRAGDRLTLGTPPDRVGPVLAGLRTGAWVAPWRLPWTGPLPGEGRNEPLHLIPGPHWPLLSPSAQAAFLRGPFRVGSRSDRMGLRLDGPALALENPLELVSAGVATGTLQLPPDGGPILLLADRQTTGGYPRLGEMASVDLPWAAQLRPGEALGFRLTSVAEAQERALALARRLDFLARVLDQEWTNSRIMG